MQINYLFPPKREGFLLYMQLPSKCTLFGWLTSSLVSVGKLCFSEVFSHFTTLSDLLAWIVCDIAVYSLESIMSVMVSPLCFSINYLCFPFCIIITVAINFIRVFPKGWVLNCWLLILYLLFFLLTSLGSFSSFLCSVRPWDRDTRSGSCCAVWYGCDLQSLWLSLSADITEICHYLSLLQYKLWTLQFVFLKELFCFYLCTFICVCVNVCHVWVDTQGSQEKGTG